MLGVSLVCVFYTEVVDAKGERDLAADVSEYPRSVFAWYVARGLEVEFESVVGDAAGLLQAIHAFLNFH